MTPDHIVGSPGVNDTNTPLGQHARKLALRHHSVMSAPWLREILTILPEDVVYEQRED
jgi:hypothetical protein